MQFTIRITVKNWSDENLGEANNLFLAPNNQDLLCMKIGDSFCSSKQSDLIQFD